MEIEYAALDECAATLRALATTLGHRPRPFPELGAGAGAVDRAHADACAAQMLTTGALGEVIVASGVACRDMTEAFSLLDAQAAGQIPSGGSSAGR